MTAKRIVLLVVAVLFAAVAGGIAFVVASFDAGKVKAQVIAVVKEKKQRTLRLDGDVALSFFPRLGIRLNRASLSERNSDQEFAAVDEARVAVQVIPLLKGQFVVDQISLDGVRGVLVRRADGSFNFDDLLSKDKEESQTVRFDIAGVKLAKSSLTWRDEKSGTTLDLTGIEIGTGRIANAAEGSLRVAMRVAAAKPETKADLALTADYRYDLTAKQYALAKAEATVKGVVAGVPGVDLVLDAAGVSADVSRGALAVEGLAVKGQGKVGADSVDLRFDAPKLSVAADRAEGAAAKIVAKLAGVSRQTEVRIDLAGVSGSGDAFNVARIGLEADAIQGATTIKGRLASSLTVDLKARTLTLPKIAGDLDIADPAMPMKRLRLPVEAMLRADLARKTAAFDFNTRFDETTLGAKVQLPRLSPPEIAFDLVIDRLDLDRYLPPPSAAKDGAKGGAKPEAPIDLKALQGLDAHGGIRIGSLQVAKVKLANIRIDLKAKDGRLHLDPLAASLYGGSASGAVSADSNGNLIAVRQNLLGVNINPLMKDALEKDVLEGRGNVSLDVTARGATVSAMKRALAGNANLALRDGAIKGINLAQTFREAKALVSARQDAVQQAKQADKTDFTELTASFKIAGGVAHNDDLTAKSPFLRLGGSGNIDIGGSTIDYLAKATVVNTSGGQGAKDLGQLNGLTVPVRITGPFERLSFRLEYASLIGEAAKAKIEEKKQELQQKAQETVKQQLGDKLKGFLR